MSERGKIKFINNNNYSYIYTDNHKFYQFIKSDFLELNQLNTITDGTSVCFDKKENSIAKPPLAVNVRIILQNEQQSGRNRTDRFPSLPIDNQGIISDQFESIDNFALKLNKACRYYADRKKFEFFHRDKKNSNENVDLKYDFSKLNIVKGAEKTKPKTVFFNSLKERQKESILQMGLYEKNINIISCSVDWRLIVGLGNESVYKTSMTLHHIYGIPYIPAESFKGVIRSWIIINIFGVDDKPNVFDLKHAENRALTDPGFTAIFGDQKHQGKIIFFDAFPTSAPNIEVDVMNPHYGPYYSDKSGNTPPADYYKPNPIPFLTVGAGTEFQFIIGIKPKNEMPIGDSKLIKNGSGYTIDGLTKETSLLEVTKYWAKKALTEHGIGAKTAVGYGYFKNNNKNQKTTSN